MRSKKAMPKFNNEDEEREYWSTHESVEHLDWSKAKKMNFSHVHPSTRTISIRLPEGLLDDLRRLAHRMDVPYQSLVKIYLSERVEIELKNRGSLASEQNLTNAGKP